MAAKKKTKKAEKKTSKKSTKSSSSSLKKKVSKAKPSKKVAKKKVSTSKKTSVKKSSKSTKTTQTSKLSKKAVTKKVSKKVNPKKDLKKKVSNTSKKSTTQKVEKVKPEKLSKEKITKSSKSTEEKLKNKNKKTTTTQTSTKKEVSKKTNLKKESTSAPIETKQTKTNAAIQTSQKQKNLDKITIEKILEETKEEKFLPQSINPSSETKSFSENLPTDLSSVYSHTTEDLPEPPGKFTLEFILRVSPELLYKFLTDPIELTEWFCDDVNIRNGIYTFVWNGVPSQARLVKQERNRLVRFHWIEKNDGSYFEFAIQKNQLTGDVVLYVTDFSPEDELESNKLWWKNQISKLKSVLGLH